MSQYIRKTVKANVDGMEVDFLIPNGIKAGRITVTAFNGSRNARRAFSQFCESFSVKASEVSREGTEMYCKNTGKLLCKAKHPLFISYSVSGLQEALAELLTLEVDGHRVIVSWNDWEAAVPHGVGFVPSDRNPVDPSRKPAPRRENGQRIPSVAELHPHFRKNEVASSGEKKHVQKVAEGEYARYLEIRENTRNGQE